MSKTSICTYRSIVIHIAVMRLVGPHNPHHVEKSRVGRQTPVIDGNGGGGGVLVLALLEIGEKLGVGMHGLFFEVAGEAVSELGRYQVAQEVEVEEDALDRDDEGTLVPFGACDLHECHEVHSLVLGLFEQGADPAAGVFEAAEGAEVEEHASYHSGDGGDGFQQHGMAAMPPLFRQGEKEA